MESSSSKRNALLACGYGVVLGAYFGLVIGLRINPDFLDHWREVAYTPLIILFGVVLHASRSLSARVSWAAFVLCCMTHILVAVATAGKMSEILDVTTLRLIIGFIGFGGLFAQGIGRLVRRHLLSTQDSKSRFRKRLIPWLPLLILAAMTLNTIERHVAFAHIRAQRDRYGDEVGRLHQVAFGLVAQAMSVTVQDGDLIGIAALHKETFAPGERIEVILVFKNQGSEDVVIQPPLSLARFFVIKDKAGNTLPFNPDPRWEVADIAVSPIRVSPNAYVAMFVPLRPYYSLDRVGSYTVSLNFGGRESAPIDFMVH